MDQTGGGALHRTAQAVKKFAHMAGMIIHAEFLMDNVGQDGRGPDSRIESVSHRAAFNNVVQMLELFGSQFTRASRAMAFFNSLWAVLIPVANPSVDTGAMNVKQIGDLGRGKTIGTEEESL